LSPIRGRILMPIHAMFPYGGAPAPLYNPLLRLQGLASLTAAPAAIRYGADAARLNPLRSRNLSRGQAGTMPVLSP
jgi:hypothetical protein